MDMSYYEALAFIDETIMAVEILEKSEKRDSLRMVIKHLKEYNE